MKSALKLGIIGCQTSHSGVYLELFNSRTPTGDHVDGARITHAWDYEKARAEAQQAKYPGLTVCQEAEQVIGNCDVILLLTDDKGDIKGVDDHLPLIRQIAAAGKPAFVDKPLANTLGEAMEIKGIMAAARLPLMSCSSFNWAECFDPVRDRLDEIRPLRCAWSLVGNGCTVRYGIHLASVTTTCLGSDIIRVSGRQKLGPEYNTLWLVELEYADGTIAQLQGPQATAYVYRIDVWGEKGHLEGALYATDKAAMSRQYQRQMARFIEIVNGAPNTDRDLDLPSLALTLAINDSVNQGKAVEFAAYKKTIGQQIKEK